MPIELATELLAHRLPDLERGGPCLVGVVLLAAGRPENSEQAIADELVDMTAASTC